MEKGVIGAFIPFVKVDFFKGVLVLETVKVDKLIIFFVNPLVDLIWCDPQEEHFVIDRNH